MFSDWVIRCHFLVLCLLPMIGGAGLSAQVPLVADEIAQSGQSDRIRLDWRVDAAERALESGLASSAEAIFRSVLSHEAILTEAQGVEVRLGLAKSLIAQNRFVAARAQLELIPEAYGSSELALYLAIAVYGDGGPRVDLDTFRSLVDSIDPAALPGRDAAWYALLEALVAELDGDSAGAVDAFREAANLAQTPMLRAHFESLGMRHEVLNGEADDTLAAELGAQLNRYEGQAAAYPFVREYAVVLHRLGRTPEAIGAIDRELANTSAGYGAGEREQLRLLKGIILGADSISGRAALKELIRNGKNRAAMAIALQLLARAPNQDEDLLDFLKVMITRTDRHPLLSQMYYLRSQLALKYPEMMSVAEEDARILLEQFPGLSEITNVYRLLAYAALKREPPQYRAAADFLIQLRDQSEDASALVELNRLIGDCYFLNGDFANAVDFYGAARNRELNSTRGGDLFLRMVSAQVRSGEIEPALQLIDEADFSGNVTLADRWRAEWNLAQALQSEGAFVQALQRVRLLLEESTSGAVPAALDIRVRWLEAYLSLEAGDLDGLGERVTRLLTRLNSLPENALEADESTLLKTEILLLRGSALIRSGDANEGMAELVQLREEFGDSAAAQRSYLTEAAYHGLVGDFVSAQNTLTALAETYPDSPLAPQALFEAALYCERRGADFYSQAVVLHNDLADRYPDDLLYYYARLKQGNLLRSMNDFAGAQIIYENLINRFPAHEMRYIAELSRADCMLALAGAEPGGIGDAVVALERLLDLPNIPLDFQTEVAYKWAFALLKSGSDTKAKEVLSLSISRFLLDGPQAVELGATGRYWVSRSMLKLGEMLEKEGAPQEARKLYRKMVAYDLPGRQIAISRADRLIAID
jgi:tetratricopeptide (TPR) repeat protein